MDKAPLISYPMLPEFEKAIPKPLKKRYRDFFTISDEDTSSIDNLKNVVSSPLHRSAANYYRKSVIKCSLAKHISIIDLKKLHFSGNARTHNALSRLQISMLNSPYLLEDVSYLINSPAVKFTGKLKVKWREEYENLKSSPTTNGCDYEAKVELSDVRESKTAVNRSRGSAGVVNSRRNITDRTVTETMKTEIDSIDEVESSTVRKLERARKGLIYQRYMADSSYSRNKKEKNSFRGTRNAELTQPRKRGRPRLKAVKTMEKNDKVSSSDDTLKSPESITIRLEGKRKNSNVVEYSVVDTKKLKSSSHCNKRPS